MTLFTWWYGIVHRGWLPLYLHGKTCWFTALENSNQIKNSGPVFFWPGIAFTIDTNQFLHVPKNGAKAWNSLLLENEIRIFVWNIPSGLKIMTIHFQIYCFSWKFSAGTDPKVVFRLLPNQIFGKRFVNSKQPVLSFSRWDLYVVNF